MIEEASILLIEKLNSKKTNREINLRSKVKSQEWFFTYANKLPLNWLEVNFMDITWLITCGVAKKPDYVETGIPFLSAQNVRPFKTNLNKIKYISEQQYRKLTIGGKPEQNDILYTRVGNCGEAAKIKYDFEFGVYVSLTLIKPIHELVNSDYLVAFLNSSYGKMQANVGAIGIGLKNLNVDNVRKFKIPLPPLITQKAIVTKIEELFSELDKGIENLKTVRLQLKVYRQSVLKWAFEGRLTNEIIEDGQLPEGWLIVTIKDLVQENKHSLKAGPFGSSLKKEYYVNDGYKVYGQEQVISGDAFLGNYFISESKYQELKSCKIKPNDILISLVGTVGKVLILPENCLEGVINPRLIKISLDVDRYLPKFFKYYFESSYIKSFYSSAAKGTTMDVLNLSIIKTIPFPLPPINEQKLILQEIESRLSVADKMEETITESLLQAEALRQSILKKAFEGKLIE